jgi:hypothetical protein
MIQKPIESITKADIESLVSNQVRESRTLDYKQELSAQTDGQRKEFLADVSSFANAAGGDILFGVTEKRDEKGQPTGLPETVCGIAMPNSDAEIRRLESIILNGIEPRVPGIRMRVFDGFPKGSVLLLRTPKSWTSPHMVTAHEEFRFFTRNNTGKHRMDVSEVRIAFDLSQSAAAKIRRFREDRLSKVISGETSVPLDGSGRIVLHIFPFAALDMASNLDISRIDNQPNLTPMNPYNSWGAQYNLDGVMIRSGSLVTFAYVQVFRNGAIEAVDTSMPVKHSGSNQISAIILEREIIHALTRYLEFEKQQHFEPPFIVMLNLVGVKDAILIPGENFFRYRTTGNPIDRDVLTLPEVIIDDMNQSISKLLKPTFDALWQSAGWDCSKNYDDKGEWTGDKRQ